MKPGADFYNHSTQKYYCRECAWELNTDRFNRVDALKMYGHDLCTEGQLDREKYDALHDAHWKRQNQRSQAL